MANRKDSLRPARTAWRSLAAVLAVALGVALLIAADGQRRAARLAPLEIIHHTAAETPAPTPAAVPTVSADESGEAPAAEVTYVLNANTRRFHRPDCPSVRDMKEKNRRDFTGSREDAVAQGYKPCGRCNP